MEDEKKYVTELDLLKSNKQLENKMVERIESVDNKVDTLSEIVLPLVESSKQTAENTSRIAQNLDEFTREQRMTNGRFYDSLHAHELELSKLGHKHSAKVEEKKSMAKIVTTVIVALSGVILAIIELAPLLFK